MAVTPRLKLPYSGDVAHNEAMNKLDAAVVQDAAGNVDMLSVSIDGVPVNPSGGGPATQLDANGTILDVNLIGDGQFLKRVGTTVVSAPVGDALLFATHLFTAAELAALNVTPITLIAAPNSGLAVMGIKLSIQATGGTVSYDQGNLALFYGSSAGEAFASVSQTYPLVGDDDLSVSNPTLSSRPVADLEALAIVAVNDAADPTVGDGTIRVSIVYALIAV